MGGLTALIDLNTGRLGRAAYHYENNYKMEWRATHPDTNAEIEGVYIPNWDMVKAKVLEIANALDELVYVGWDIVVTEESIKIIEGNNCSDVNILQVHQPLLLDERTKDFYKYYKILT